MPAPTAWSVENERHWSTLNERQHTEALRALQTESARRTVLQVNQTASANQAFVGTSEHVVKTQVLCELTTDMQIAVARKDIQLAALIYICLLILWVSIFENPSSHAPYRSAHPKLNPSAPPTI